MLGGQLVSSVYGSVQYGAVYVGLGSVRAGVQRGKWAGIAKVGLVYNLVNIQHFANYFGVVNPYEQRSYGTYKHKPHNWGLQCRYMALGFA